MKLKQDIFNDLKRIKKRERENSGFLLNKKTSFFENLVDLLKFL